MDLNKHIWEGWTVQDFIDELEPTVKLIMSGKSHQTPFESQQELVVWLRDNQPYYKKDIREVITYFTQKYLR